MSVIASYKRAVELDSFLKKYNRIDIINSYKLINNIKDDVVRDKDADLQNLIIEINNYNKLERLIYDISFDLIEEDYDDDNEDKEYLF